MASLVVKDVFGNIVSGNTFPYPTTEDGTSQFIRVSFDPQFTAGQSATLPVDIAPGSEGTLVSSNSLSYSDSSQEYLVEVRGVDDASKDGSLNFTVNLGPSTGGNPNSFDGTTLSLTLSNSDNDGASDNRAPTEPTLLAPADGVSFEAGSNGTQFEWQHAYDADKDDLLYHLCFSQDSSLSNMRCVTVTESNIVAGSGVAGLGWVSSLLVGFFLLSVLWSRLRCGAHGQSLRLGALFFVLMFFGSSCGNQALLDTLNLPARPKVATIIPTTPTPILNASGTWYWRVYADDQEGNVIASSQTRSVVAP